MIQYTNDGSTMNRETLNHLVLTISKKGAYDEERHGMRISVYFFRGYSSIEITLIHQHITDSSSTFETQKHHATLQTIQNWAYVVFKIT